MFFTRFMLLHFLLVIADGRKRKDSRHHRDYAFDNKDFWTFGSYMDHNQNRELDLHVSQSQVGWKQAGKNCRDTFGIGYGLYTPEYLSNEHGTGQFYEHPNITQLAEYSGAYWSRVADTIYSLTCSTRYGWNVAFDHSGVKQNYYICAPTDWIEKKARPRRSTKLCLTL